MSGRLVYASRSSGIDSLSRSDEKTDGAILGSTTFYGLLYKMIDFARISGHSEDIDNYKTHAEALKKAYNKRFFNYETAQYGNNSVTGNLLSLRYGLVPDGYEKRVF